MPKSSRWSEMHTSELIDDGESEIMEGFSAVRVSLNGDGTSL